MEWNRVSASDSSRTEAEKRDCRCCIFILVFHKEC